MPLYDIDLRVPAEVCGVTVDASSPEMALKRIKAHILKRGFTVHVAKRWDMDAVTWRPEDAEKATFHWHLAPALTTS